MANAPRIVAARALAVVGTVLVGLPLASPILLGAVSLLVAQRPHLDFLLPGELFPVVLVGAALLLAASLTAETLSILIGTLAAASVILFGMTAWIADATGLASGVTEPSGGPLLLLLAVYALYVAACLGLLVFGIALCRAAFAPSGVASRA